MQEDFSIVSAGAGSGKTYRLTEDLVGMLRKDVRVSGIIATTFTKTAAAELRERVRIKLLDIGMVTEADALSGALIGTVHSLGVKLLRRFAFEAGVSPQVEVIAEEDQQFLFRQSLAMVLTTERIEKMERLSMRLGQQQPSDWRSDVQRITDVARANDFTPETLRYSRDQSAATLLSLLGEEGVDADELLPDLASCLEETLRSLEKNDLDTTQKTAQVIADLEKIGRDLRLQGTLSWNQWLKLARTDPGAKSRNLVEGLCTLAWRHEGTASFKSDIRAYIETVFDTAIAAIDEYGRYKQVRGLIDYNDMEVKVKHLLALPRVQAVLRDEIDLLLVDEFQDTSPLQLDIFLALSRLATHSIWVGDPKQSIYGFRGAEPSLMQALIQAKGGIRSENILKQSWRSRADIVHFSNAVFTQAFSKLPAEQVILQPVRRKTEEPEGMGDALVLWHFQPDLDPGKMPANPWSAHCIAQAIAMLLRDPPLILPKGETAYRRARAGDMAVLCRSNGACSDIAEALHQAGWKAAIARSGLMKTAEARLITACLRYLYNRYDSLAVAELLLLAGAERIEDILCDRLDYLQESGEGPNDGTWAEAHPFLRQLNALRDTIADLSGAEILHLVLEVGDLPQTIARWGDTNRRLGNVEILRKNAREYEEACQRLHSAASLGGLLLWWLRKEKWEDDPQFAGTDPDTVQVLTYHRSKGLEWPIVICSQLDAVLKDDVFGIHTHPSTEALDLEDLRKGRWIRFWIQPYGLSRSPRLQERLENHSFRLEATRKALEEEIRLLYVGCTRARDYLILPVFKRTTQWLNRVCNGPEGEDHQVLSIDDIHSPWEWEGTALHFHKERFIFPRIFPETIRDESPYQMIEPGAVPAAFTDYFIKAFESDDDMVSGKAAVSDADIYHVPAQWSGDAAEETLLAAITAWQDGFRESYPAGVRESMAGMILDRLRLSEAWDSKGLSDHAYAFYQWLNRRYIPARILHRYPVRLHLQGRYFETVIDFLIQTQDGRWVIIQHYRRPVRRAMQQSARRWAAWMHLSSAAIQTLWQTEKPDTWIHFPLEGALVQVFS